MKDGYRSQLVARLEPESPNPLAHKGKIINAHADEQYAEPGFFTHKKLFLTNYQLHKQPADLPTRR